MFETEPDRWVGLLVAFGVLLALVVWYVLERASSRLRALGAVTGAVLLIAATAAALSRTSFVGLALTYGEDLRDDSGGRQVADVFLSLAGLAIGLVVAVAMYPRTAVADGPGDDDLDGLDGLDEDDLEGEIETVEDEPPIEEEPPVPPEDATKEATKDAYWSSHAADGPAVGALPALPFRAPTTALLLVALAVGMPVAGFGLGGFLTGLLGAQEVDGWAAAAAVVDGLVAGLALLVVAFALRGRDTWAVIASFAFVAAGQGLSTAWPETFANEFWFMFATGLAAGLLLPTVLRVLSPAVAEDGAALAGGVLIAVALVAGGSMLESQARESGYGTIIDNQIGVDIDNDGDVIVPPFPTFPVPTFTFPSFPQPTFTFPSFFGTFQFPTDFPTGP